MCRYCEMIETGVPGEKTNDCVFIDTLGDGSQLFSLLFFRSADEENGYHTNELIIELGVDIDSSVRLVKDKHINIKYCPFCGEEL